MNILLTINVLMFLVGSGISMRALMSNMVNTEEKLRSLSERLKEQNQLISNQKNELELVYDELASSINYASKIQDSVLPPEDLLIKNLSEHFVLYIPKEKVSGDFYWWTEVEDETIIVAADCTGHGVPGAFMSMLGMTFLREIIDKGKVTNPKVILEELRLEVIKGLRQQGLEGEQKDGLDIALISINHKKGTVHYSGANNPIYLVTSDKPTLEATTYKEHSITGTSQQLYEFKPDKMPIGIHLNMDDFSLHEFKVSKGDIIYLFSDGYADQFGGNDGKKYRYSNFRKLLLENSSRSLGKQKEVIEEEFQKWRANYEQIDDVLVVGVRI